MSDPQFSFFRESCPEHQAIAPLGTSYSFEKSSPERQASDSYFHLQLTHQN
ncbi:hypothetical protein [Planomicrobium sp. YIM 101495]|uniref:hypothetical protein n=1 Tax=Planomicrobium sp. YIM 101495 TaxID=2665160 RepID=UPI0012B9FA09|nr:hypothetical protein [Planomicrobium sp. YIM 101495]MTD32022.1 hypothetical protein [Planomicrobium sp. YIM 101495]